MELTPEQMALLFETCPNIPFILKGLYKGVSVEELYRTAPCPEDFDEDMEIMVEIGLLKSTPLEEDETPTFFSDTASVWERE